MASFLGPAAALLIEEPPQIGIWSIVCFRATVIAIAIEVGGIRSFEGIE
jgi:hypothetical protein